MILTFLHSWTWWQDLETTFDWEADLRCALSAAKPGIELLISEKQPHQSHWWKLIARVGREFCWDRQRGARLKKFKNLCTGVICRTIWPTWLIVFITENWPQKKLGLYWNKLIQPLLCLISTRVSWITSELQLNLWDFCRAVEFTWGELAGMLHQWKNYGACLT